jgi:hypothetical protein
MVRVRARDECVLDAGPKSTHHQSIFNSSAQITYIMMMMMRCVMKGPSNKSVGCIRGWGEGTRERERE